MHAGRMELFSVAFYPVVLAVLDTPGLLVLGSVPVARYGRTMPQVCVFVCVCVCVDTGSTWVHACSLGC